jgi:hypothetical protein
MKVTVEAQAEPEWDETHEDQAFGLADETEWMKRAEIRVMAENGIDTSEIQWLELEVSQGEEARWTIDAPEATVKAILAAGWQQAAGLNAALPRVEQLTLDSNGPACVAKSPGNSFIDPEGEGPRVSSIVPF